MNSLQEFYDFLDNSEFDKSNEGELCDLIKKLTSDLFQREKFEEAKISDLERQAFSIQKSFDHKKEIDNGKLDGLSWQFSGTQKKDTGEVIPFYWPDVSAYTDKEFEYFEDRFQIVKNLYAKVEYGLLVYFGKKTPYSKHKEFKQKLFRYLFELGDRYYKRISSMDENKGYTLYFIHCLETAFRIAEAAKLKDELNELGTYIFKIHQNWDISKPGTIRMILDLSGLMSENFKTFKKLADFDKVILKNLEGADALEKIDKWGSIAAISICIGIQKKSNKPFQYLISKKALLYEKLAEDADNQGNMSAVSFIEDAVNLYKEIKSKPDLERTEKKYFELRGKFKLGKISKEFDREETDQLFERIKNTVSKSGREDIINMLIISPWYPSLEQTREMANEHKKQSVFLSLIPTVVMDKFGNTIERFTSDAEKIEHNFLTTYGFNFQIGTQTLVRFFLEAFHAKKLSFVSILNHLESTWVNEEIERIYYGQVVKIKPIDILKPPIKYFFDEMERYRIDNAYKPDFITVIDSLTLKIEGLIRYFVERLGIPTFKFKDSIAMEKLLDDLLADLAHMPEGSPDQKTNFDEDDRFLIKYVMTSKSGYNLRNKVAHSLLDADEYDLGFVIVLFCIILKLTKYKFIRRD